MGHCCVYQPGPEHPAEGASYRDGRRAGISQIAVTALAADLQSDHEEEDLADFDPENLEVAQIDNSAEARLLEAFPGAEEVV